MHCLEVIVERNEQAAAREQAHARNEGNLALAGRIATANALTYWTKTYRAAYDAAIKEG